ncbi:hypothetical protein AB0M54_22790 [Actinoplanes sp. NPDC051470]|uniref:hypothetical protein n=1 Tax=unclassified Actinoplanes TaxID=2626549 RepID=UPI0034360192
MLDRGAGAILLSTGLSGLRPMPMLGSLAPASAAMRMYGLTLHDSVAADGVFVGTLTIGGLVARGEIHQMFSSRPGGDALETLDPDAMADTAWQMVTARGPAEHVFITPSLATV